MSSGNGRSKLDAAAAETRGDVISSRLAAIDVGTNSVRLIVADVEADGTYRVLDEEKEVTRLGEGLEKTGWLAAEPIERSLQAISKMKAIAEGQQVSRLRAIATSAVREARNGSTFCRLVEERCSLPLEVISSDDEARHAFRSVVHHFNLDDQPTAVVDIGGGSVEVVLAAGTVVDQVFSAPLGAVRLTERYIKSDPVTAEEEATLNRSIDDTLREIIGKPPFKTPVMIGSGGTFSTLAEILQCQREGRVGTVQGTRISIKDAARVRRELLEMSLKARRQVPGLSPARADIVVAGLTVIVRLAKRLGSREIWVNDKGIRDGLLLSMIDDLPGRQAESPQVLHDRMESVRQFARKCRANQRHAEQVAQLATGIFRDVGPAFGLPADAVELLEAAAYLHEVGYLINHVKHQKHAYHLIIHADLPGFSAEELELIANVARYHRGSQPKKSHANFNRLKPSDARLVAILAGILRLAVGLDRTHGQQVRTVHAEVVDRTVRLLVVASNEPRVELWAAERKSSLFCKALDVSLEVAWAKQPPATSHAEKKRKSEETDLNDVMEQSNLVGAASRADSAAEHAGPNTSMSVSPSYADDQRSPVDESSSETAREAKVESGEGTGRSRRGKKASKREPKSAGNSARRTGGNATSSSPEASNVPGPVNMSKDSSAALEPDGNGDEPTQWEPVLPSISVRRRRATMDLPAEHFLNRELSWVEFNARVLEEANDPTNPWLERLKFLGIFSSNLDEFFEIRVAGLQQQLRAGVEPQDYPADGMNPLEQLTAIDDRVHQLVDQQYHCFRDVIIPHLAERGVIYVAPDHWTKADEEYLNEFFEGEVYPVLSPLAIDPGHPFPHVHSKSLNVALLIERYDEGRAQQFFAVVQVPSLLNRVVNLPQRDDSVRFVLLEDIIRQRLDRLFGNFRVLAHTAFRVTRNADLTFNEDEADDLLDSIEKSLRQRHRGDPVRLEISADGDERFVESLVRALRLEARDVYRIEGPLDLSALAALQSVEGFDDLKDEPLVPRVPLALTGSDIFEAIRARDILLHHPYESFGPVVDFINQAADDPRVLAIKQTLYRTSSPSPIINALARAAQNGKQVTALVEVKARHDEANNIVWAKSLEEAGVHVVYGVVGLKTHCKAALVVRNESDGVQRYVHLATGNYNTQTARIYTDLGLFTRDPDIGLDTTELFNLLTGYSQGYQWRKFILAPFDLLNRVLNMIELERKNAEAGKSARIICKMNSLVEPEVIESLYRASQAGVQIDLAVRGICCLRPGVPGLSSNIRVSSVVDKFLEHSRIFYFENAGEPKVFLASADWMPRNFFRRIEVMFPIDDPLLKRRITDEILPTVLADNVKARLLEPDGTYRHVDPAPGENAVRSQVVFQSLARRSLMAPGV